MITIHVDLRQQRFQQMLDGENQTEQFDMAKDDEMDDQTLSATMDDAEEQHERQISQISKRVSSEQIADLHERAQRARQLEGQEGRRPSIQSMVTAKTSDTEDLPPLEPLMTEDEAAKRLQAAFKGRIVREETLQQKRTKKREQKMDNADSSSTIPADPSRRIKETIDYSTDMKHWKQTTNIRKKICYFNYI